MKRIAVKPHTRMFYGGKKRRKLTINEGKTEKYNRKADENYSLILQNAKIKIRTVWEL